jgi:hypothetical protein
MVIGSAPVRKGATATMPPGSRNTDPGSKPETLRPQQPHRYGVEMEWYSEMEAKPDALGRREVATFALEHDAVFFARLKRCGLARYFVVDKISGEVTE